MPNDKQKFRAFIDKVEKEYGKQGWWPRVVRIGTQCAVPVQVKHHPGPKSYWLSKTLSAQAFEVSIGAILTQNTTWTNVEKALICLAQKNLLTSRAITSARLASLESCVKSSGYYRQKAKKLKLFARFVEVELGGDLRHLDANQGRENLLGQWGIGPETADTILLYGLNRHIFVIDAYTRRLLVRLTGSEKWLKLPYDEVRAWCEEAMGKSKVKMFQEAHALIVRWGKEAGR